MAAKNPKAAVEGAAPKAARKVVDRTKYKHCVWVGTSASPKFWLTDMSELDVKLAGVKASKLNSVTIGDLKQVKVTVKCEPVG